MSLGILGHSPIPEEDAESDAFIEDSYTAGDAIIEDPYTVAYTVTTSVHNITTTGDAFIGVNTPFTSSFLSLNDIKPAVTSSRNMSIPEIYPKGPYIEEFDDKIEEYREDYEEGVLPPLVSNKSDYGFNSVITEPKTVTAVTMSEPVTSSSDDYFYENSSYLLNSKLSTIPETVNDIYLSNTDIQSTVDVYEEQLVTPGAYDYTENENDYIASGDLKNTNLYQGNSTLYQPTTISGTTISAPAQPEQKKSRFGLGSLFSDGLNVIGSSVNSIKSTATNLAGGAVGVVGGVAAAAAAAASSQSTHNNPQNIPQNNFQNQNQNSSSSYSTTTTSSASKVTTYISPQTSTLTSTKLTKQTSEVYDELNDEYLSNAHDKLVRYLNHNLTIQNAIEMLHLDGLWGTFANYVDNRGYCSGI